MKQIRIVVGVALALASSAAMAVSGERWYGTNRGVVVEPVVEPIVVEQVVAASDPLYAEDKVVYFDPDPRLAPVLVDSREVYSGYVVYEPNLGQPRNPGYVIENAIPSRPNESGG